MTRFGLLIVPPVTHGHLLTQRPHTEYRSPRITKPIMAASVSSISKAFADAANSIHIPKPAGIPEYKDEGATASGAKGHAATALPTPPNSISPNLPAHSLAGRARRDLVGSPPSQIDSDVELGDALQHAKGASDHHAVSNLESGDGVITPALIARDFLPGIILGKGQVPVKDVIKHLCENLPGFADIPPAKARRIVGAALEGHVGGVEGNIEFEKTGWGRWNARVRTQPLRTINEHRATNAHGSVSGAMKIPGNAAAHRKPRRISGGSWAADSSLSSPSEHGDNVETGVFHQDLDAMSIDGDADHGVRYAPTRQQRDINTYSDTDEEDWASIGAAALRASSYGSRSGIHKQYKMHRGSRNRSPLPGGFARSLPGQHHHTSHKKSQPMNLDFTGVDANTQEREAIEALMRMGSM